MGAALGTGIGADLGTGRDVGADLGTGEGLGADLRALASSVIVVVVVISREASSALEVPGNSPPRISELLQASPVQQQIRLIRKTADLAGAGAVHGLAGQVPHEASHRTPKPRRHSWPGIGWKWVSPQASLILSFSRVPEGGLQSGSREQAQSDRHGPRRAGLDHASVTAPAWGLLGPFWSEYSAREQFS